MKTRMGFMVFALVGLALFAAPGECRKFGGRQKLSLAERTGWDYQAEMDRRMSSLQAFGALAPERAKDDAPRVEPSKPGQRAFDLCLSRCAAPVEEPGQRRAGAALVGDLNDAALMQRLRKVGMGLSWRAAPNVGFSADYEKVMDAADVGRVAPDTVRARMQWDF
ncbi:hypothetical protein [Methylogaea oryzae]|nr:hypothetical protein [Methylogaea oryzae]